MDFASLHFSIHAYKRMCARDISSKKLAQIVSHGQIYSTGNGRHVVKFYEHAGKSEFLYEAVISKKDHVLITVWKSSKRYRGGEEEQEKQKRSNKQYKQRKLELKNRDYDSYCSEEYGYYNMRFSA